MTRVQHDLVFLLMRPSHLRITLLTTAKLWLDASVHSVLQEAPLACRLVTQGGATVARLAHNQKAAGSTPAPATIN